MVQGPDCKVEGPKHKKKGKEEGGCKKAGVGTEKDHGRIRVWRLGGLGAGLGYSLSILKTILFSYRFRKTI